MRKEKEIFFDHLKRAGYKRTAQREPILDVFLKNEGHSSVEELYRLIKAEDPNMASPPSTARSNRSECGLAREERFSDGRSVTSTNTTTSTTT